LDEKKKIKKTKRKKVADVVVKNGQLFCPHCNTYLKGTTLRTKNYGVENGKFWSKKICPECENYIMFWRDSNLNILNSEKEVVNR
jgi:uncharacterized radical SAM superfamily Fe-S cluster-containing enzyme